MRSSLEPISTIRKILVPFDENSPSMAALEYAAMFASGIGATITALHLMDPERYHSKSDFQKDLARMVDGELRPKLIEIRRSYPDIHIIHLQTIGLKNSLPEHVIDFANENEVDFIILRSHESPMKRDWENHFNNTNAYKIVLEAQCPVFTFGKVPLAPRIKDILVPLDLTEGSLSKIPLAISFAKHFGATIHLLSGSEHSDDFLDLNQLLDAVKGCFKPTGAKVIRASVYRDTLPEAITRYTDQCAIDLILIMSRPGFRWSDLWISPKAKKIIAQSLVPVVCLRANEPIDVGL